MQGKIETKVGIFVLAALGVLAYMGFHIGAFRFDRSKYNKYTIYFKDISGLSRKAEVKIAGVKVGWVEHIALVLEGEITQAQADVMIHNQYTLYKDAYAIVRQEGLLGPKYLEVIVGDPLLPKLTSGSILNKPSVNPVSTDDLLQSFKKIASNVEQVTDSLRDAVGTADGKEMIKDIVDNVYQASEKIAAFSNVIERSLTRNEDNIDSLLAIGEYVRKVSDKLELETLPAFKDSVIQVSQAVDRDFDRIASKIESTATAFEDASVQARDGLRSISNVAEKIDEGRGILGKLVNDDEAYRDLRVAIQGFKNYLAKVDMLQIVFDSHFEGMYRPAEHYRYENAKGYFEMRIHPRLDYFYLIQMVNSEKGFVNRKSRYLSYDYPRNNEPVDTNELNLSDEAKLRFVFRKNTTTVKRNQLRFGIQFGKIFGNIALRFGLFDGTGGMGFDFDIPFPTDKFRWVTTFEAFDFYGWNRIDDRRPHLKWINRMYIFNNIYLTFGADDFVSKNNANAFFGAGVRFGDDDVKYLLSSIGNFGNGGISNFNN